MSIIGGLGQQRGSRELIRGTHLSGPVVSIGSDAYFQIPQTLPRKSVIQRNIQAGRERCGPCHGGILVNVVQVIFPTRIKEFLVDIGCVGSGPGTAPTGAKAVSVEWGRELSRVRNWARKSVVK